MKRICDPSSGKLGNQVYLMGRNGQVVRTRVIPSNPKSSRQLSARAVFTTSSKGYDALTQEQQLAWISGASSQKSASRLGMNGALTGNQLFVKVNANLTIFGGDPVTTPPVIPTFAAVAPQNLVITLVEGVPKLTLSCPTSPGENTVLEGAKPTKCGVHRVPEMYMLGTCAAPVQGSANITSLYAAKFGSPALGSKVFIRAYISQDGYHSSPVVFSALVPLAT